MELLIIILNKIELLNDLLSILVEAGIDRATILDSEGLGRHLADEMPVFAGLKTLLGDIKMNNKTVLSLIDEPKLLVKFEKLLKETDIDFSKAGTGIIFTVPVTKIIGLNDPS